MTNNANEISRHYSATASLYELDKTPKEELLSDKITRQYIMGSQTMVVKWTLKKGAVVPLHFHPNEQITCCSHPRNKKNKFLVDKLTGIIKIKAIKRDNFDVCIQAKNACGMARGQFNVIIDEEE